jgi:hypothetical protein
MHMGSREKCNWIRLRVETPMWLSYNKVGYFAAVFERICMLSQSLARIQS